VITCCIEYTIEPHRGEAFTDYAHRWLSIIARSAMRWSAPYLAQEGANNNALALIDFATAARRRNRPPTAHGRPDAQRNVTDAAEPLAPPSNVTRFGSARDKTVSLAVQRLRPNSRMKGMKGKHTVNTTGQANFRLHLTANQWRNWVGFPNFRPSRTRTAW